MENDQNYCEYPITYSTIPEGVIIKEETTSDEEDYDESTLVAYSLPGGVIKDEPQTGDAYDEEDVQVLFIIASSFQIFPPYLFYSTLDHPIDFLQYSTYR